jgi:hypothetical protein
VCLEAPNCKNFETWGFTDKYSWIAPLKGLPFDTEYKPKPAFFSMYETLKNFPRDDPAVIARTQTNKISQQELVFVGFIDYLLNTESNLGKCFA